MRRVLAVTSLLLTNVAALAGSSGSFTWIPDSGYAMDVTPDGSMVVGMGLGGGYYWTADGGYVAIGGEQAVSVSDDGTKILGTIEDPDTGGNVAAIWTAADGWQPLGGIGATCGFSLSSGYAISGDGTTAVGLGWVGCTARAFKWTEELGIIDLGVLGSYSSRANAVSGDGSLVLGWDEGSNGFRRPAIWTAKLEEILIAGDDPGEAHGVSRDGTVVVGGRNDVAFRWTEDSGFETLGFGSLGIGLPGQAYDISDDGEVIVGFDGNAFGGVAWIWDAKGGIQSLRNLLWSNGVQGLPSDLIIATAVSADGSTIVGHNTFVGAWIATLPVATCDADFTGDGSVGFDDLTSLLGAWGPCGFGPCDNDLDGDGTVGFSDLTALLGAWGPCS